MGGGMSLVAALAIAGCLLAVALILIIYLA
jgi:hypothetical protein